MKNISDLEQKGLIDALGVKKEDLFEAKYNLLANENVVEPGDFSGVSERM